MPPGHRLCVFWGGGVEAGEWAFKFRRGGRNGLDLWNLFVRHDENRLPVERHSVRPPPPLATSPTARRELKLKPSACRLFFVVGTPFFGALSKGHQQETTQFCWVQQPTPRGWLRNSRFGIVWESKCKEWAEVCLSSVNFRPCFASGHVASGKSLPTWKGSQKHPAFPTGSKVNRMEAASDCPPKAKNKHFH